MRTVLVFKRSKNVCDKILHRNVVSASPLHIKRAVVFSKMTRYDVERACNPGLSPKEVEKLVRSRGSNFDLLIEHHQRHKDYEQYVINTFKDNGIDTKVLNKSDDTNHWIDWCDAVFPVGGDGTFLLASSRVHKNTKPVIGLNSDPDHSEGFLCLPKKYSTKINDVLLQLREGSFSWMFRTRIRVTVKSKHEESLQEPQDKRVLGIHRTEQTWRVKHMSSFAKCHQSPVPCLALNEVFIGETLSSQVSYFEMKLSPGGELTRVKSSGLCLSTGTGSSSWHLSMNRLTPQSVSLVLQCAGLTASDADAISSKYNDALLFDPEEAKVCYTVRELISAGVWPSPPGLAPRGFAQTVWVRSHCHDARLVIDGGASCTFNDGSEALFELYPDDTLRTVVM